MRCNQITTAHITKNIKFRCGPVHKCFTSSIYLISTKSTMFMKGFELQFCFLLCRGLPPTFAQKPSIKQAPDGSKIIFSCKLQADPQPVVSWFHDDAPVR